MKKLNTILCSLYGVNHEGGSTYLIIETVCFQNSYSIAHELCITLLY